MHNFIYQVSLQPINEDENINPEVLQEMNPGIMDYAYELDRNNQQSFLEQLVKIFPNGMFAIGDGNKCLDYLGGFSEWHHEFCGEINAVVNSGMSLIPFESCDILNRYINNPLNTKDLFVFDFSERGGTAVRSIEAMRLISEMKVGDKLYVGAILGYHW